MEAKGNGIQPYHVFGKQNQPMKKPKINGPMEYSNNNKKGYQVISPIYRLFFPYRPVR